MSNEGLPLLMDSTSIKVLALSHLILIICAIIDLTFSFVLTQKKQKVKAVPTQPKITTQKLNLKNSPWCNVHRISISSTSLNCSRT